MSKWVAAMVVRTAVDAAAAVAAVASVDAAMVVVSVATLRCC